MIEAGLAGTVAWSARHRRPAVAALAGVCGAVVAGSAASYLYSTGPGKRAIWAQLLDELGLRGDEEGGYAVLLIDPRSGIAVGLHHHEANPGQPFHESRTGLDHISFGVADRASLDAWASWPDELGIEHSGVIDIDKPMPYSVVVFRDPDNLQLELFHMAS